MYTKIITTPKNMLIPTIFMTQDDIFEFIKHLYSNTIIKHDDYIYFVMIDGVVRGDRRIGKY